MSTHIVLELLERRESSYLNHKERLRYEDYLAIITPLLEANLLQPHPGKRGDFIVTERFSPLDEQAIWGYLTRERDDNLALYLPPVTTSTNDDVQQRSHLAQTVVAVSEMQQAGRGRRGRRWISPPFTHLYFSLGYHYQGAAPERLSSLSLLVGMRTADILQALGIDAEMKWPNDLWVGGRKLGGILIETKVQGAAIHITIGIGINNLTLPMADLAHNRSISCEEILGQPLDRNRLTAHLIDTYLTLLEELDTITPYELQKEWRKKSALYGKEVTIFADDEIINGEEVGIAPDGALLIALDGGEQRRFYSGDVSLRPSEESEEG